MKEKLIYEKNTWYKSLGDPHGEIATEAKHAPRENVGGATDDRHADECPDKELCLAVGHVHLYQHCGHHKHQEDHPQRRQDS